MLNVDSDEISNILKNNFFAYMVGFCSFILLVIMGFLARDYYVENKNNKMSQISEVYNDLLEKKELIADPSAFSKEVLSLKESNSINDLYLVYLQLYNSGAYIKKKQYKEAIDVLESISPLNPEIDFLVLMRTARAYIMVKDYDSSLSVLEKIKSSHRGFYYYETKGDINFMKKDYKESLELYKKALSFIEDSMSPQSINDKIHNVEDYI